MLRVILVAGPTDGQVEQIAATLEATPLTDLYAAPDLAAAAGPVALPHSLQPRVDERLAGRAAALELITSVAETQEGTIALVAPAAVVWEVLVHALDAPVPAERLALDPGAIAEVEVRLDAPWTVNRINDGCHLETGRGW